MCHKPIPLFVTAVLFLSACPLSPPDPDAGPSSSADGDSDVMGDGDSPDGGDGDWSERRIGLLGGATETCLFGAVNLDTSFGEMASVATGACQSESATAQDTWTFVEIGVDRYQLQLADSDPPSCLFGAPNSSVMFGDMSVAATGACGAVPATGQSTWMLVHYGANDFQIQLVDSEPPSCLFGVADRNTVFANMTLAVTGGCGSMPSTGQDRWALVE